MSKSSEVIGEPERDMPIVPAPIVPAPIVPAEETPVSELALDGPGDRLRRAREAEGLSLKQVATETRIPERHLSTIEEGRFGDLPGRTYAVGFSRNYAKAVGLDEKAIAEAVRAELGTREYAEAANQETFEPGDPARIPSRRLAWFGTIAAVLLIAGLFAFYRTAIAPGSGPGSILTDQGPELVASAGGAGVTPPAVPQVAPSAPVTFTATRDGVWVRFYDAAYADTGQPLMEKQMALGEKYTVPSEAQNPQLRTGWPAALDVAIAGRRVGKLSEDDEILSDVDVTAPALAKRLEANNAASEVEETDAG